LLSIGKSVEAARVLHARYSATCAQQSYATQIMAAQDGTLGEIEPEWRSLTHPPSWTAMSIINAHWEYWDSTHDHELLTRHYHYLRWLANLDFEEEPLIPFGGDEPFYTAFQQELPAALSSGLLPDPSQYSDMRPYPWGAAPAMARVSALEHFAAIAEIQGDDAAAAASLELAERLREHTESTYWLASAGYYAAALSRVDHELYLAPHLPTALAPLLMAYGTTSNEHVRTGVNTALQYLLEPNGLPRLTPAMPGFPGELLGQLLACLSSLADVRMTAIYHAILASASPAGEFRSRYIPPEYGSPCCGGADPMVSTWIAQGLLAYLCTMQRTNERFIVAPNLPPEIDRIHLENMNVALFVFEVIQQREGDHVDIRIGNISGPSLHVSLRNPGTGEIGSMSILPGETNHTTLIPAQSIENLPERQTFVAPSSDRLAGRMLILTVDADSFADWQQEHDAVVLDASMVISVEQFTQVLLDNNQRRYETLYFDVPTMGAAWTGLSQDFWDDPKLQSTLTTFRELGGQITSTRYVEEWDIYIPGQPPVLQLFPNGWVSMPPVNGTVTATSHLICENGNAVETLLYATNDTEVDVWVNGERIWRRGKEAEGQRVRIETDLLAGENIVTVNCNGHMDHAMGFCLGLRGSPDK
ncbi:MAG TPA: hypothetical protein VHV83_18100, partial [Armatimonadota bacterium]|nr:hypothetical protein [Armatimonadota bacterium]